MIIVLTYMTKEMVISEGSQIVLVNHLTYLSNYKKSSFVLCAAYPRILLELFILFEQLVHDRNSIRFHLFIYFLLN